jgi:hypothetical protein
MKNVFIVVLTVFASLLLFFSCQKEEKQVTNEQALNAIREYATVQNMFAEATDEADNAARVADDSLDNWGAFKGLKQSANKSYPQISIEPFDMVTWPKTIRINYGPENIVCEDGRERRGIINILATDFYRNEGCQLTTSFEDYYQNDYKLEGTRVCTNQGENNVGKKVFNLVVTDGILITPQGAEIAYKENTTRIWIAGDSTLLNPWDDNYHIVGTQNGISSEDVEYSLNVDGTDPLDVLVGCKWIRAGLLKLEIETLPEIRIDYGDGNCDNDAVAIINGESYPFEME